MEDKDLYHLIVNPYKVNREKKVLKKISTIDNTLISLFKKKYPKCDLEDNDYNIIINNLDKLILKQDIDNYINNYVDNIVEEVINKI
jgi:hypothetical protein